jgi:hypothetical protein
LCYRVLEGFVPWNILKLNLEHTKTKLFKDQSLLI